MWLGFYGQLGLLRLLRRKPQIWQDDFCYLTFEAELSHARALCTGALA